MKIVLLGDIGSVDGFHAGDEAMAAAVVEQLAARTPVEIVAVSGNPDDTISRYGWDAVPRVGFALPMQTDAQRDARLAAVLGAAGGDANALAWSDSAWNVIHAVAEADAVVISGGGNLSSIWPEHVYERAALAGLAALFNKRLVVTGQTVGPHLTARHGELVGRVLTSAALVGARESASAEVTRRLGVPSDRLVTVVDDATYLSAAAPAGGIPAGRYVAATFAPDSGVLDPESYVAAVAALCDEVTRVTGLRVVLVPHQSIVTDSVVSGDVAMHQAIASAMHSANVEVLSSIVPGTVLAAARNASLVISARYHPIVFALGASVPSLGIAVDAYTSTKIGGAMANFGVSDYTVSVASLAHGDLIAAIQDLIERSADIAAHLERVNVVRMAESAAWWDAVTAVLAGGDGVASPVGLTVIDPFEGGSWTTKSAAMRTWSDALSLRIGADRLEHARARAEAAVLDKRVDMLEREVAGLTADLEMSAEEIDGLRVSAKAAHELVSAKLRPVAKWLDDRPSVEEIRANVKTLQDELDAVYRTRTFRYLNLPRKVFWNLRH